MTITAIVERFQAKPEGDGYRAKCPAHDDRNPSLTIREGRTGILVKCHAGCDTASVLAAVGLTFADLSLNGNHAAEPRGATVVATYVYRDSTGTVRYRKVRTASK